MPWTVLESSVQFQHLDHASGDEFRLLLENSSVKGGILFVQVHRKVVQVGVPVVGDSFAEGHRGQRPGLFKGSGITGNEEYGRSCPLIATCVLSEVTLRVAVERVLGKGVVVPEGNALKGGKVIEFNWKST